MRRLAIVMLGLMVWAAPAAAQFVAPGGTIPAVANLPGVGGTFWRSDVSVLNINDRDITIVMYLLPEIRDGGATFEPMESDLIQVPANSQVTFANVVQSVFGLINRKGALSVLTLDGSPITLSSRTYTFDDEGGSYGQDIHALLVSQVAWAPGVREDAFFRTNVGIFLPMEPAPGTVFTVTIFDDEGNEQGSGSLFFPEAGIQQRNVEAFGVGTMVDGYAVFSCSDPTLVWYGYASRVDQTTGDAVYRAARGRQSDLP
jgi:hypothetical protein